MANVASSRNLELNESLPRCLTFQDKHSPPGSPAEDLCPFCSDIFDFNDGKDAFLTHLLGVHKLVIADVKMIANFSRYIYYWRDRLLYASIEEFCTVINTNTKETDQAETEQYYLLCDALPEDFNLRKRLHNQHLEELLTIQASERNSDLVYNCLFCKHGDTRSEMLTHMLAEHSFNIGQPNNLVKTDKLFELLQNNLENLKCLYCEKTFTSRHVLKEHMRKKKHKRINKNNKIYDQFYISNYLEFTKVTGSLENKVCDKNSVDNCENVSLECDEHERNWDDWTESSSEQVHCLFCEVKFGSIDLIYSHMKEYHRFDFKRSREGLDFYSQIKLVNFIRYKNYHLTCFVCDARLNSPRDLDLHYKGTDHPTTLQAPDRKQWDQAQFYFSTFEDDAFLCSLQDVTED